MQVIVSNKRKLLGKAALKKTEARIVASFAKFGRSVKAIELVAEDVNGPRCGLDKQCRLVVRMNKMNEVVVTAKDESLSKAISSALGRAERAVARTIQRRSLQNAGRNSRLGFADYR